MFPFPYSRLDAKREWGKLPRPRCLPKTALHRYSLIPNPCSLIPAPYSLCYTALMWLLSIFII
ncbi:MAG: hypothetical protein F6J94_26545 [Moorea sp. SIO1F2]|uniref:hypothetical protein n=1 Tax=Moorena sp. SIO1F2 TaxID=2607819 RepID=UPI0013BBEF2A|nr:hypothetical protein [Moorena sp. SIO1F2]NET85336.1 hypothetical protein [Moorena sp. SIO1F2]